MIIIEEVLISDPVIEDQFMCNLEACKGACCWEGDFGAPLEMRELDLIDDIYEEVKAFMVPEGRKVINRIGKYDFFEEPQEFGTPLLANGACAYMVYDNSGIAQCSFEIAYRAGKTDFLKPISCHLYPIRINKDESKHFEALNYDVWDICSKACELGKKRQMPVFRFAKAALIRKYGQAFYDQLEATVAHLRQSNEAEAADPES
ncbi:MAG: DUF3109 family protein [Bacteroidota bacterium]